MLLQQLKLPKKLRTVHYPGKKIELWINGQKVANIKDFSDSEQLFLQQFVSNLRNLGWTVLMTA